MTNPQAPALTPGEPPTPEAGSEADIAARLDRIPTGRFHVRLASYAGTGTFFDGFDAISLAVILPLIVAAFGISFADAGMIISAGYAGQFVGAIAIGFVADRYGRKKAFIICLAVFGLLSLACAFATSATSLLVFRLLQGIGLGAEVPVAATLMNEYLGRKSRGRISMLYQSTFTWGLFFAPLVALAATEMLGPDLGWRVLLGLGAIPVAVAVAAWFYMPESARWLAHKGRADQATAYVEAMEREATDRGHVLAAPVAIAAPQRTTFRPLEMFAGKYGRRTLVLAVAWFFGYFVVYGYAVWLPSMYVAIGGLAPTQSLKLTILLGVVQLAVVYASAWAIERVGRKPLLSFGFATASVGALLGLVFTGVMHETAWPFLFSSGAIIAIGISIPAGVLYLYTSELYPTRMRGFATSSASSLNRLASIVSPFAIGFMIERSNGAPMIFGTFVAASLIALVVMAIGGVETRGRRLEEIAA
jgi:putative MFS transporter